MRETIEKLLGLGGVEEIPDLAEQIGYRLERAKLEKSTSTVSKVDLLAQIDTLQKEIREIQKTGISMWNYKSVIPKVFDVVDSAFVILREIIKKLEEK